MSTLIETGYLDVAGTPSHCVLHRPSDGQSRDIAVVICPPFGWEEVCSYRGLREWAIRLVAAGYPTLRLTYPGCGDSGGSPREPDRLEVWTEAVAVAARAARAASGARAVVALGLGLGGLLAYRCAATRGELDGLALWATPGRAKDMVRQLRVFGRLEFPLFFEGLPTPPPLEDGDMEVGGFLLAGQTVAELNALDLTELSLLGGLTDGALLFERDGIAVDKRLRETLEREGISTRVVRGDGYGDMTSHPQQSELPDGVVDLLHSWLDERASPAEPITGDLGRPLATAAITTTDGARVRETPVGFAHEGVSLAGVLATPEESRGGVCVLFMDAGGIRRIGPNRMWVEVARRWAARGIPTLRFDVEGIGDAGGAQTPYRLDAALHDPRLLGQVTAAIDELQARGVANRFALAGLCSGAYWALHVALDDPRVSSCLLVNPRVLVYDTGLAATRDLRRLFSSSLSWSLLRRNVTFERLSAVLRLLLALAWRRLSRIRTDDTVALSVRVDIVLGRLEASGKPVAIVFSDHEPLEEELAQSGWLTQMEQWPHVLIQRIAVRDHTLRPLWGQQQALTAFDIALERVLEPEGAAVA